MRIDANGGWSVDEAVARIPLLERAAGGLEYVEQPVASVEELAPCADGEVPIAADESIRRAADPYRVRDLEAADIAVLKVQPLGGVRACLRIAEDIDMPVVVSSAVESSVGIAAGLALAAALPELPHACGLATVQLLTGDVVSDPLLPVDGALPVRRPVVDPVRLSALAASPGAPGALAASAGRGRGRAAGSSLVTPTHPRPSAALATWLVDQLVERGVTDVVLCPGSRNAPVSFALLADAADHAAHPHRRAHRRLPGPRPGQALRRPTAVVTTSGTAAANLHPAVLEAAHAGVPLVLVTADRPARLRGTGANQTTDQVRLFGDAASFADLAGPDADALDAAWLPGGPVHLNVQLDEPLVPRRSRPG